ncbi:hypothetical protein V5O48_013744 [Marasmius crinis-equi]|uniref:Uncharacterized protein n=1 Tax=Marasmius crinis-equi TaxID=585013 RepID=A0ABR3EZ85_9AGAR
MSTSMIEIEFSDNLTREHPTIVAQLNAAIHSQHLNIFLCATEGPLVYPGRKTIGWSGVGSRLAMVWLNAQEVLQLVFDGQLLNFVNEFRRHCGHQHSSQQTWAILYGLHAHEEYQMCQELVERALAQVEVFTGIHLVPVDTEVKAVTEILSVAQAIQSLKLMRGSMTLGYWGPT